MLEDIQAGARDLSPLQRAHQSLLINDGAARSIDDERAWFHHREFPVGDHVSRFRIQRRMQ